MKRGADAVTELERSLSISARPRLSHALERISQSVLLHFR